MRTRALAWLMVVFWTLGLLPAQSARLAGSVSGPDGSPLAGALVGVIDQESAKALETRTDAHGSFELRGLVSDRSYRVVISKYGFESQVIPGVRPSEEPLSVRLARQQMSSAQAPVGRPVNAAGSSKAAPTFRVSSDVVILNVSVKDSAGKPIPGLTKGDFSILENGARQEITHFQPENAPVSTVLLMDVSSSMEGRPVEKARDAAARFIRSMRPDSEIAILAFDDQVRLAQDFTSDQNQALEAVSRLSPGRGTALYDAISKAVEHASRGKHSRHALVLLSDGKDEDSRLRFSHVERLVNASNVVMFAVGLYNQSDSKNFLVGQKYYKPPEVDANLNPAWVLMELARSSGGDAFFPSTPEDVSSFFDRIASELRNQYVLGFVPRTSDAQGFRKLEVKVDPTRDAAVDVQTRTGYLSGEPAKAE